MKLFTEKTKNIARWSIILHIVIAFITMPTYQYLTDTPKIPYWGMIWMAILICHLVLYFIFRIGYKLKEIDNKYDDENHPHSF